MKLWIDAQLSSAIAAWIKENWPNVEACSVRSLGLRDAKDDVIFEEARKENVVVVTKDSDFVNLQEARGSPPKILLLTFGNATNRRTKELLEKTLPGALKVLEREDLVEISSGK